MKTIRQITIITQAGTRDIEVGRQSNGVIVDRIEDSGVDEEFAYVPIFSAYDKDNKIITQVQNCPITIDYFQTTKEGV